MDASNMSLNSPPKKESLLAVRTTGPDGAISVSFGFNMENASRTYDRYVDSYLAGIYRVLESSSICGTAREQRTAISICGC
jgi:hypothetical protein